MAKLSFFGSTYQDRDKWTELGVSVIECSVAKYYAPTRSARKPSHTLLRGCRLAC
jgi:hypothetical protein